jgi:hypothetical protein
VAEVEVGVLAPVLLLDVGREAAAGQLDLVARRAPPPPGELDSATLPSTTLVRLIQPVLAPVTRYQSPLISAIVS